MKYVEAPDEWLDRTSASVFLAGGITGCPDWQREVVDRLQRTDLNLTLLNPRRANFPIGDPGAAAPQIRWEYTYLRAADVVLFWFPAASICPIVLYELGAWSKTTKPIVVGYEPGYVRMQDVIVQTALARPEVNVVDSLGALCTELLREVAE